MAGSGPRPRDVEDPVDRRETHLSDDDETQAQRASLLTAAANARNVTTLTGTHGVVAMPLDQATIRHPEPKALVPPSLEAMLPRSREGEGKTTALVRARIVALSEGTDDVAKVRAHLELARALLDEGDVVEARRAAEEAGKIDAHAPAVHAMLRTLAEKRTEIDAQRAHVEALAADVEGTVARADYLTEKARLIEAEHGPTAESVAAYEEALALVVDHAGALAGLEPSLEALGRWSEFSVHLGRLAGLAGDPKTTAWFFVERALVLDRRLSDVSSARALLGRALALSGALGPVRSANVDHAVLHREDARLAALLEQEADLESDTARATCLLLDAALIHLRTGDAADPVAAIRGLERALASAKTSKVVDARVSSELADVYEARGAFADALRVRKHALQTCSDPSEKDRALRAVAVLAERAGAPLEAVQALERAREISPDDPTILEELDRVLTLSNRHDARAVLWSREATLADDPASRARAWLRSAEALRASGRAVEADRQLQSAWVSAPGAPGIFDALVDRIPSVASRESVSERLSLYERAANVSEPAKRLHYLEKIAWLWDDVLGEPRRAAETYEEILAIDPRRASAVAGLVSCAGRTGDRKSLARALLAEVEITEDPSARDELRLRAAEALSDVDEERARVLAEDLFDRAEDGIAERAGSLLTRLEEASERWERAQEWLGRRAARTSDPSHERALILSRANLLRHVLRTPGRALSVLDEAVQAGVVHPAVTRARLDALLSLGDEARLREALVSLGEDPSQELDARVGWLVRAAEMDERHGDRDAEAVRLYGRARELAPDEPWVRERLWRIGARTPLPAVLADDVPLALRAIRSLEREDAWFPSAEPLLAEGTDDVAMLRIAERTARFRGSIPQLANTLSLEVDTPSAMMAKRALSGLSALVTWKLPESSDLEPWGRLLEAGVSDVVMLDDLVARARGAVRLADEPATKLSIAALGRRWENAENATERLLFAIDLARLERLAGNLPGAAAHAREALTIDPSSVSASSLLAEVAASLGDRKLAIEAALALADVTVEPRARATLLRDAADLYVAERDLGSAVVTFERALATDPDFVAVAARLAQIQSSRQAFGDLARALRRGVHAAQTKDAVVPMASELADVARQKLSDPPLAIEALERLREVAPEHVASLFLLSELYIGQRAWEKALDALAGIVEHATSTSERITGLVGRASIFRRVLEDVRAAEKELRAALAIDSHEPRVLRPLLELRGVTSTEERAELLSRLVGVDERPAVRLAALLELAEVRRSLGDEEGAEGALVEASALSPDDVMLQKLHHASVGRPELAVRLLGRGLARAKERGVRPSASWLADLGDRELSLGRVDDAIEHLDEALRIDPSRGLCRLSLGRALAMRGRHAMTVEVLRPLLEQPSSGLDQDFVRSFGDALQRSGRPVEARVADELRAWMGDADPAVRASLEARRSGFSTGDGLLASALRSTVMPAPARNHPFWDVAALTSGFAGKFARVSLAERGASTKSRLKPRAIHPLRQLVDRVASAFDLVDVEVTLSDETTAPFLAVEDVPWLVLPSQMNDWPEPHALASLAGPLLHLALGLPWYGAFSASEVLAMVVALGRQATPAFGASLSDHVESLVSEFEPRVRKLVDRKKRRSLDDLAVHLEGAEPISEAWLVDAVTRTAGRTAFLLSGDLRAAVATTIADPIFDGALRVQNPSVLGTLLSRPLTRDLVAFAFSPEATALRRSLQTC